MEDLQSAVITVLPQFLDRIVGGTIILLSFAMCGRAAEQRNVGELMVADADNMRATFIKCNNAYFEGKLPIPLFDLLHSFRTCGYFQYTTGGWFDKTLYDPIIFMTDYYDFTEKQFVDIMVHEMIHYYLAYFDFDKRCRHGKKFKEMAERLNMRHGLHITSEVDLSQYKRREGTPSLSYWLVKKIYMT